MIELEEWETDKVDPTIYNYGFAAGSGSVLAGIKILFSLLSYFEKIE
jgi:hypothetical protein